MTSVKCAPGFAIVMLEAIESETSSGIILRGALQDDFSRGRLIVVGSPEIVDGKKLPFPFNQGDLIAFSGGRELRIEGNDAIVVHRKDVVCAFFDQDEDDVDIVLPGQLSLV